MWNLISHAKGRTYIEDVWEEGAEENTCPEGLGRDGRLEKIT